MMGKFKLILNENLENLVAMIISGIASFFFLMKSPLHPWIGGTTATDSSVFKTIAMIMEKGGMPYVDSFDHKGPLLYILNWLGNRISQYRGIWVIEFLSLTITIFVIYKIARLVCGKSASTVTTFMAISLLFNYFDQGNLTEEYAMPCISVALFIFLDYFLHKSISSVRLLVCGFCCGCVLLLRPNMVSMWFAMCIGVLIQSIVIDKQWKKIISFLLWFILGAVIIVFPIGIWLLVNGALNQCIQDYIIFNMVYNSPEGGRALFSAKWNSYFTFTGSTVYLIAFFGLIIIRKEKNAFLNYCYLFYLLIIPLFICLSGMTYDHYGMVIVPAVSYPIALAFYIILNCEEKNITKALYYIFTVYCLSIIILPNWIELVKTIPSRYEGREEYHTNSQVGEISAILDTLIGADDEISVYGNWNAIYVNSNRAHATRYSYQFPIGSVNPQIMGEYFEQLGAELPHVIVVQSGHFDDSIIQFLNENEYNLVWSQNGESLDGNLIYYR